MEQGGTVLDERQAAPAAQAHVIVDERIIAMVALERAVVLDPAAIVARVRTLFPWLADVGAPRAVPGEASGTVESCVIPIGDGPGAGIVPVMQVPYPIPAEALAEPIGRAWAWPEAQAAFDRAGAHVIVSALSASSDPRYARMHATWVTCVAAAVADLLPAVGVYWVTAGNVLPQAQLVDASRAAGADGVPFDVWVATHFYPGPRYAESQEVIARTTGLSVFVGREVECGPSARPPGELGTAVRAVGWYVLDRRVEFAGGETVGTEDAPIGRIALGRTAVGVESGAVYRVLLGDGSDG